MTLGQRMAIVLLFALGVWRPPTIAQTPAAREQPIRFVTLGTGGGPVVQIRRSQPANALVVGKAIYLFDAGDGVQRQLKAAGLSSADIRGVFLSHHHLDHIAGLGPLVVNRWLQNILFPLPIVGPPRTAEMVHGLAVAFGPTLDAPLGINGRARRAFGATLSPRDLRPLLTSPTIVFEDANVRVLAVTNNHFNEPPKSSNEPHARSYSFRIEAGGRSIVYSGDTGPSPALRLLARNADVLVSEVMDRGAIEKDLRSRSAFSDEDVRALLAHMDQDHMTPEEVGRLAAAAKVKRVVLTHLVPGRDYEANDANYLDGLTQHFRGPVVIAKDLDSF